MYLKLSNGKSRFSIICLRKKGHVCFQNLLWCIPERDFDMRTSIFFICNGKFISDISNKNQIAIRSFVLYGIWSKVCHLRIVFFPKSKKNWKSAGVVEIGRKDFESFWDVTTVFSCPTSWKISFLRPINIIDSKTHGIYRFLDSSKSV